MVNTCIEKMSSADGIILGSPVYFFDVTPEMKALIDRAGFVSFANGHLFKNKVGNATVAVRRAGASRTADSMLHFILASEMIVSGLPAIGIGRDVGDVLTDEEGIARAKSLGQTMAQLLNHLNRYPLPAYKPTEADGRMTKKRNQ
jgi:multimeric flavodoxin WrbA